MNKNTFERHYLNINGFLDCFIIAVDHFPKKCFINTFIIIFNVNYCQNILNTLCMYTSMHVYMYMQNTVLIMWNW